MDNFTSSSAFRSALSDILDVSESNISRRNYIHNPTGTPSEQNIILILPLTFKLIVEKCGVKVL